MRGSQRISVLLVNLSERFGGADVRVMQLASLLSPSLDVHVVVLRGSETEARFVSEKIPVISIPTGKRDPRTVAKLVWVIGRLKPTIIDLHNLQSQLWGLIAARLAQVPVRIATFHSVYEESERFGRSFGLYGGMIRLMRALATNFISVSETVDAYLADNAVPQARRAMIHNGLDVQSIRPAVRHPFADREAPVRLACVGRLVPVKGHRFLLQALAGVSERHREWECYFIGDGPELSALQQMAEDLGVADRSRFLGYRTDVADLLGSCDVICMPSLSEGLPYTIFEAALLERPIVASAVGGIARHFRHRDTIYLVEPGNVDQIKKAIEWAIDNPREAAAMGQRARRFVAGNFTSSRMAAETEAFYLAAHKSAVGEPGARSDARN